MRFVFDTSVLIDYLRGGLGDQEVAADAFTVASGLGDAFITLISLMELYLPVQVSKAAIEPGSTTTENSLMELCHPVQVSKAMLGRQLERVGKLMEAYRIKPIPCSKRAQEVALEVLKNNRSLLGKNALTDSLVIASGLVRRAYLVTNDKRWFDIAKDSGRRGLSALKVISPTDLVQRKFLDG